MGLFFKKVKEYKVVAPFDGEIVAIESLKDQTFATKVMGDGIAIIPTSEEVFSPVKGTIASLLDTKHAYGITSSDGFDVLIHIGQDTVNMNGEGFTCNVKEEEKVNFLDKLGTFDIEAIIKHNYEIVTPVILIDGDYKIKSKTTQKTVKTGDVLFIVEKK